MKTKYFYLGKIDEAKANIRKWELCIYEIDNPKPLKVSKQSTRVISIRVDSSKADIFRKKFIKLVNEDTQIKIK